MCFPGFLTMAPKPWTGSAFQKALDDIAANVSAGTDFSLEVLTDHFDEGTRLLADNLLHPALPAAAFDVVRMQVAARVAGEAHSPATLSHRALKKALFPKNDPALRWASTNSVSSLSLDDVNAYYRQVMRPDETIIVVVGHIQPNEAEDVIMRYFGELESCGAQTGPAAATGAAQPGGDRSCTQQESYPGSGHPGPDGGVDPRRPRLLRP